MVHVQGVEVAPVVLIVVPHPVVEIPGGTHIEGEGEVDLTVAVLQVSPLRVGELGDVG